MLNNPFPGADLDLSSEILELIAQIPSGRVSTYGDLAAALGDPEARSARWIGEFLHVHEHATGCCCHRVVRQGGDVGLHVISPDVKAELLKYEGIPFVNYPDRINLTTCRFQNFQSRQPLGQLMMRQREWAAQATLQPLLTPPEFVVGLDVAYPAPGIAMGAGVVMDVQSRTVVHQFRMNQRVSFPYIPGFLSFRELPVLLELWRQVPVNQFPIDAVFIDGNGRLHPLRAGIATCFGVLIGKPTIGIGKSLLCGTYDRLALTPSAPQPIVHESEEIGFAMLSRAQSRPIFVSPGNLIDGQSAVELTRHFLTTHRTPEPIYHADRLSKLRN